MDAIHAAKIGFWIKVKESHTSRLPFSTKVDPEATVVRKCIADPVGVGTTLDDDDDAAAIVECREGEGYPREGRSW